MTADARGIPPRAGRASQARRERIDGRVGHEYARLAVDHRVERAAAAQRDDRTPARLRLNRDDAEVLFAWQHRGHARLIEFANLLVLAPADEIDAVTRITFEVRTLG